MRLAPAGPTTGIILAGGRSSRMGRDKAALSWRGVTMLDHLVSVVGSAVDEVLVVVDEAGRYDGLEARVAVDQFQGCGPLGGLHAGLHAAQGTACFVCSCDVPLLRPELVRFLLGLLDEHVAAVPITADGPQPLCAAYRSSVLPLVERQLIAGQLAMRALVAEVSGARRIGEGELRRIDPQLVSFTNVNTHSDFEQALIPRAHPSLHSSSRASG